MASPHFGAPPTSYSAAASDTNLIPQMLDRALEHLSPNAKTLSIVNRSWDPSPGERGSTIDVTVYERGRVTDVDLSGSNIDYGGGADPTRPSATIIPVAMSSWKKANFAMTDLDKVQMKEGTLPMQASGAVADIGEFIDSDLLEHVYKESFLSYGTLNSDGDAYITPFTVTDDDPSGTRSALQAGRILDDQYASGLKRRFVVAPATEAQAAGLRSFSDVSWSTDPGAIMRGEVKEKLGFTWHKNQQCPTHTAGTAGGDTGTLAVSSAVSNAIINAGDTTIPLKSTTAGTLVKGDLLTIGDDPNTYVVTEDVNITTSGVVTRIFPALRKSVFNPTGATSGTGIAADVAVKRAPSHRVNLAWQENAVVFVTRSLPAEEGAMQMRDPLTGVSLRLQKIRPGMGRTVWVYDVVYGRAVVRRQHVVRVLGPVA